MTRAEIEHLFGRADKAYEAGKFRSAFHLFLAAAKAGDSSCQINLGDLYCSGIGVKPNRSKALYWYKRAFRGADGAAATNIGLLYREEKKLDRALAWFERAAKLQDGDANLEIAKIYLYGKDDETRAIHYLKQTCKTEYVTEASEEEAEELLKRLGVKIGRRRRRWWRR
jgi:TPR repeat protein